MTTLETLRESETPTTEEELDNLMLDVSRDREKFDNLLKNPTLKSWLDKIFAKEAEHAIQWFWKDYKKFEEKEHPIYIEWWTKRAIKAHPDLSAFICWDLWLPYKDIEVLNGTKFNELTTEQKMGFISFHEAFWYYGYDLTWVNPRDFINQCKLLMNEHLKSVTDRFNSRLSLSQNFFQETAWIVNLEKVLKRDYWLTDAECKKMNEYLKILKDHPEYTTWVIDSPRVEKAMSKWWWMLLWIWIWMALSAWWYFTFQYFKSLYKLDKPQTIVYWERTELYNFKEVFKAMSLQVEATSNRRRITEDWLWHFDETTGWFICRWSKWVWNRIIDWINAAQHRNLDLELHTTMWYIFDINSAKCDVKIKNWKWTLHVKVKRPEARIIGEEAKIHKSRRERINVNKFDDFDLKALDILRQEALTEAKKPENIEKAKESLRKNILGIFQSTWINNNEISIKAENIQDVVIEYID